MAPSDRKTERRPFWAREDRTVLWTMLKGALVASLLPARGDAWWVSQLTRRRVPKARAQGEWGPTEVERRMRFALEPHRPDLDFPREAARFDAMHVELAWLRSRALRSRRVPISTTVEGLERLSAATGADGSGPASGAILWGMSFCGTLPVKIALHRAGVEVVHLSGAGHGGAHPPTRFGIAVVSPLYCIPEKRYLAERVVIPADGSLGYLRTLIDRLQAGRVVHIAGERRSDRKNTPAYCLGRRTEYARGAPGLAYRTGTALLPLSVVREAPMRYRAVIEEPIEPDRSLSRDRWIEEAIAAFAARVEQNVLRHPSDWDWYRHTVPEWERAGESVTPLRS